MGCAEPIEERFRKGRLTPCKPLAHADLDGFEIDRLPVTEQAFDACVSAGACPQEKSHYGYTWYQAHAYCTWVGMQLIAHRSAMGGMEGSQRKRREQ